MRALLILVAGCHECNRLTADSIRAAAVMGNIDVVVPTLLDEIDRLAARVVSGAVFGPVLCMSRRDVQIDRKGRYMRRPGLDDDRLRVDELRWRKTADFDETVETGLADANRNTDVRSKRRRADRQRGDRVYESFHSDSPSMSPAYYDIGIVARCYRSSGRR